MRRYRPMLLSLMLLLLAGCSEPLPMDRLDYAGHWHSATMQLQIHEDGTVAYERREGRVTTSVNGPIQEFVGDDFVVGLLFFSTTFEVQEPPHRRNGPWQMVVDGVRLTKASQ